MRARKNKVVAKRCTKYEYLMQGRLTCSRCGKRFGGYMNRQQKPERPYYLCLGQKREHAPDYENKPCRSSLRADEVDVLVWDEIRRLLKEPELLLEGVRLEQAEAEAQLTPLRGRIEFLDDMIENLTRQKDKLLDLYLTTDKLSKDVFQQKSDEIDTRRETFSHERADLSRRVAERAPNSGDGEAIRASCTELARGIDEFTFAEKRLVLETLNVKGVVVRGEKRGECKITLSGCFPKKPPETSQENHELLTTASGCSRSLSCRPPL